jgi:hypothetical protein
VTRSLADLLAAAEKRKREALRAKLSLPDESPIEGLQLESLAYHLTERSGPVHVSLDGETLRVGEGPDGPGIRYHGEAIDFLLRAWGLTREQAQAGVALTVKDGQRV